ncbi:hypothetical protein ACYCAX_22750 [Pseudomonas sp. MT3]|nr:hypothetical protein [uncultured Pseudomonas sp.]
MRNNQSITQRTALLSEELTQTAHRQYSRVVRFNRRDERHKKKPVLET